MRFQAYFTPIIKILLWILAALGVVCTVLAILVLARIPIGELTYAQSTLLISVCPICTIIAVLLATLHYKVEDKHLRLYVGFIDIFKGRVLIEKILNVVIDGKRMYVSYLGEGIDPIIAAIVINPKRFYEMKDLLISKNNNIVFYEEKNETPDSQQ